MRFWGLRKREVGNDSLDGSNLPTLDILPHGNAEGEESGPHRLHQEKLLLSGQLDKYLGLLGIDCKWLLTHDMLPGVEC